MGSKRLEEIQWHDIYPPVFINLVDVCSDSIFIADTLCHGCQNQGICIMPKRNITEMTKYNSFCTELFPSLWTFFENAITPSFVMKLSEYLVCSLFTSYLQLLFYKLFQNFDYFWLKKKSVNILWFFCQFLRDPYQSASFCVGFGILLRKNFQVLKNHQKAKIWGCWKKCLFCFVC